MVDSSHTATSLAIPYLVVLLRPWDHLPIIRVHFIAYCMYSDAPESRCSVVQSHPIHGEYFTCRRIGMLSLSDIHCTGIFAGNINISISTSYNSLKSWSLLWRSGFERARLALLISLKGSRRPFSDSGIGMSSQLSFSLSFSLG